MRHGIFCVLAIVIFVGNAPAEENVLSRRALVAHKALSALPLNEQKLLYAELSPDVRAGVWQVHLQEYLATRIDLTMAQEAVIQQAIGLLKSGIMNVPPDAPDWPALVGEPITRLNEKITLLFDRDTAISLFGRIGTGADDSNATRIASPDARPHRRSITSLGPPPSGTQDCECSHYSDWCWSGSWCNTSANCKSVPLCGTLWSYTCDGMCVTPYP